MMRSPRYSAVACRAPNGSIVVVTEPLENTWIGRQTWLKKPFLRGTLALLDTMALGIRAMRWASDVQLSPKYQKNATAEELAAPHTGLKKSEKMQIGLAVIVSLALGFAIFDATPIALAQWMQSRGFSPIPLVTNYIEEIIKIVFFLAYLSLIRKLPAIHEVFRYHGAEHKAINALEAKDELEPEAVLAHTRLHPRCGTNFAIIVLMVSFLLFPLIPRNLFPGVGFAHDAAIVLARVGIKLAILPVVAGISYEVIRAAGMMKDQRWVNILLRPGLATQLITTAEPHAEHAQVAIAALRSVVRAEESGQLEVTDSYGAAPLDEALIPTV